MKFTSNLIYSNSFLNGNIIEFVFGGRLLCVCVFALDDDRMESVQWLTVDGVAYTPQCMEYGCSTV